MNVRRGVLSGPCGLVRVRRLEAGLTQEQLAEMTGLSVRAISDIECGRTARPRRSSAALLEAALGRGAAENLDPASGFASAGRDDLAPSLAVPQQLPQTASGFVGRERELDALRSAAARDGRPRPANDRFRDCPGNRRPNPEIRPANESRDSGSLRVFRDGNRDDQIVSTPAVFDNSVRIGYARVSTRGQDHQAQLDALAAAHCREVIVETASTRDPRPKLAAALAKLRPGDTLVIYKPDRVARSMKELLVLLEDQLHSRGIDLHILTGICAGLHHPDGATIADKMLFVVAAMAAEMERDLIRERTLDGLCAAQAQGRHGGRPRTVDDDVLAIARDRRSRGESVTTIARRLGVGRSTLYRALDLERGQAPGA